MSLTTAPVNPTSHSSAAAAAVFSTTEPNSKGTAMTASTATSTPSTSGPARTTRTGRGLTITSYVLAAAVGLFVLWFGSTYLLDPQSIVGGFGLPESALPVGDVTAFLNVKGARDVGTALVLFALLATRQMRALGWALIAMAFIPVMDMTILLSNEGSVAVALGMHGATALYVLLVGAFIAWNERPRKSN